MAVKIRDVAEAADVSIATVSYVLNNSAPVSDETRRRVLEAVQKLGYRPNITARNLKASETRMIGYAWHNVAAGQINAVLDRFIYQMALASEAHGYHVLTFAQSPENPVITYDELVQTSRVDGFILSGTDQNDERIRRLMALNFPFVAFGRSNPNWDFPYVDVDVKAGIRLAVEHLLSMGHCRIACLAWPPGSLSGDARFEGYLETLSAAGVTARPEWVVRVPNLVNGGYEAARAMLSLPIAERPTAIVSLSDVMAVGAMRYIESIGLRVGADIALTGFDDDPISEFLRPSLTSLRQPIDEIAGRVIDMLVCTLSNLPLTERHFLVQPSLIVRESSKHRFS